MPHKKKSEIGQAVKEAKEMTKEIAEEIKELAEELIGGIKKTLTEEKTAKKTKSKKSKDKAEKKEEKTEGKIEATEEFPNTDIAIDVFSPVSNDSESEKIKKEKLEEIKNKAKKLAEKIEGEIDLKEKITGIKDSEKTLFPLDDYVKYSCHLGTKAITPKMRQFVYKRRADGLAVLNTNFIDEKLKEAVEFLKEFPPEDIFLACKREAGWEAAKKFSEVTGIKVFTKKYPAGIITNMKLVDFFEVNLVIICDPWLDKNALNDAVKIKKSVIGLCDTNNLTTNLTKVIPCNNKSAKSLGVVLFLLAREYLKARKKEKEANALRLEDFTELVEKESQAGSKAKEGV